MLGIAVSQVYILQFDRVKVFFLIFLCLRSLFAFDLFLLAVKTVVYELLDE